MDDLEIRRLTEADWQRLQDIRLRALQDSPDAYGRTYAEEALHEESVWRQRATGSLGDLVGACFVAERDGEPVGMAVTRVEADDLSVAGLYAMWVAPDERGKAIGHRLIERVCDWASEQGLAGIELSVTEGNGPALRLYERAGFVPTGKRERLRPGSELFMAYMRKVLP